MGPVSVSKPLQYLAGRSELRLTIPEEVHRRLETVAGRLDKSTGSVALRALLLGLAKLKAELGPVKTPTPKRLWVNPEAKR